MTISVVLIPTNYSNARETCNLIENQKYGKTDDLRSFLKEKLSLSSNEDEEVTVDSDENYVLIYNLSDFMEEVNDQQLDVLTNYFISYVQFE